MPRALAITLLVLAAALALAFGRYRPPAARGTDAPAERFSATRAREIQREISASPTRMVGAEANASARAFLQGQLDRSGFRTEVQTTISCMAHGVCGQVSNIVAVREGREPGASAVLLMAHHDSVACSPGAADDGFGVAAVIESARALAAGRSLRRNVVIVLTDGEESGLLGARAFVRDHPLARTIRGAVNIDSRGSSGPSAMFETSAGNGWLIDILARTSERPVTSSLFAEVYRRMPNDTDFTVVKELTHGVNFANIAGVQHYHTPLDSLANADGGTLQHHGEQALAMVRALADAGAELDAPRDRAKDAVWFDVLALFVVRWPSAASIGLALTALLLVVGWTVRMRAWSIGLGAAIAALVAAFLASLAVGAALRAGGALPVPWIAHPLPALLALHGAAITAGLVAAAQLAKRASARSLWAGTWLAWGTIGVVAAVVAPGASFLFVVPTLAAGIVAWLPIELATAIPAVVAGVVWLPLAVLVPDGTGFALPPLASISSTLLVSALPALLPAAGQPVSGAGSRTQKHLALGAVAGVIAAAAVALLVPPYSAAHPQRVNVVFRQDEPEDPADAAAARPARVLVEAAWGGRPWGVAPARMVRELGDPARVRTEAPAPWSTPVPAIEVGRVALPAPEATLIGASASASGGWVKRVRLRSHRGARTLAVVVVGATPPSTVEITVAGQRAFPRNGTVVLRSVPAEGIDLELATVADGVLDLTLLDVTPGLPLASAAPVANAVRAARGEPASSDAVQTQEGDVTILARRLRF